MKTWPKTFAACASAFALVTVIAAIACGAPAERADVPPPPPMAQLSVSDAWSRAADSGAMSAVYFTIHNTGAAVSDTLSGVSGDVADDVAMHMSMERNGMMHMAAVRALPVPAEDSVNFRPMGAHVMLTGLHRALAEGDTVTLTLRFASGQSLKVRAGVRKP